MAQGIAWFHVRVRGAFNIQTSGVRVVLLHCLQSLPVAGVRVVGGDQSQSDVIVFDDPMRLVLEQSRSLPLRGNPELETRQPRIRGAIGVLEQAIAESSAPSQL